MCWTSSAEAGEVLVIANDGAQVSTWGGLASLAASKKGVAGAVTAPRPA